MRCYRVVFRVVWVVHQPGSVHNDMPAARLGCLVGLSVPLSEQQMSKLTRSTVAVLSALACAALMAQQQASSAASPETTPVMVRVQVSDETDRSPLPAKSELWFRGYGSWWLKTATANGSAAEDMGRREVGKKDTFTLYPDGREAQEIVVPFMMTGDMHPDGSPKDSIMITISDQQTTIVGLPIKAATGKSTMTIERK